MLPLGYDILGVKGGTNSSNTSFYQRLIFGPSSSGHILFSMCFYSLPLILSCMRSLDFCSLKSTLSNLLAESLW